MNDPGKLHRGPATKPRFVDGGLNGQRIYRYEHLRWRS
jgi:hypothetical protein